MAPDFWGCQGQKLHLGHGILYGINLVSLFALTIYAMLKVRCYFVYFALLPLPILSISIYYVSNTIKCTNTAIQKQLSNWRAMLKRHILVSGYQRLYKKKVYSPLRQRKWNHKNSILDLQKWRPIFNHWWRFNFIEHLLVVVVGAIQVYNGRLTTGNVAEFILYVNMLTWPVTIGWISCVVQKAEASETHQWNYGYSAYKFQNTILMNTILGDIEFTKCHICSP